ncbi:hypothetical protein [Frankia sp. QA3]|nr:hypothetical protein [Frankia sp. QA3]
MVNAGFAHRRIERMRRWIAATARTRIDAMTAQGAPGDIRGSPSTSRSR